MTTKRPLTDLEQNFMEHLFGEAKGDPKKAAKLAGYPDYVSVTKLTRALREEIISQAELVMASNSAKAAMAMVDTIDDPNYSGAKERMAAAREILDRTGLSKVDKLDINSKAPIGIFILPPKDPD